MREKAFLWGACLTMGLFAAVAIAAPAPSAGNAAQTAEPAAAKSADAPKADDSTDIKPLVYAYDTRSTAWTTGAKPIVDDAFDHAGNREKDLVLLAKTVSSTRWVGSTTGDLVFVYSFYRGNDKTIARIEVDEKEREPLVAQQIRDVLKIAQNVAGGVKTVEAALPIRVSRTAYKLKMPRADVRFTGSIQESDVPLVEPTDNPRWVVVLDFTDGGEKTNAKTASLTALTGPREPWSISANVPVGQLKQLKLDDKAESLGLKDKPGAFYISFDFLPAGDAILQATSWSEAFQLLAMIKASNRPSDSYGIGIGLRPGVFTATKMPRLLQIFDTITPFAAVTRTRITGTDAAGTRQAGHRTDLILGLSLDIKKGVEWTTKKSDGGTQ